MGAFVVPPPGFQRRPPWLYQATFRFSEPNLDSARLLTGSPGSETVREARSSLGHRRRDASSRTKRQLPDAARARHPPPTPGVRAGGTPVPQNSSAQTTKATMARRRRPRPSPTMRQGGSTEARTIPPLEVEVGATKPRRRKPVPAPKAVGAASRTAVSAAVYPWQGTAAGASLPREGRPQRRQCAPALRRAATLARTTRPRYGGQPLIAARIRPVVLTPWLL